MIRKLRKGYLEFKATKLNDLKDIFKKFEDGQSPHTLFITCSDSRIDPNLITCSLPGDLFIIRNAGNYVALGDIDKEHACVASTMEFALNVLKIKNVVICGHTDCGAVKSAATDLSQTTYLKSYIPNFKIDCCTSLNECIEENVRKQIQKLKADKTFANDIKIEGWVYDVVTGGLKVLEQDGNHFLPVE